MVIVAVPAKAPKPPEPSNVSGPLPVLFLDTKIPTPPSPSNPWSKDVSTSSEPPSAWQLCSETSSGVRQLTEGGVVHAFMNPIAHQSEKMRFDTVRPSTRFEEEKLEVTQTSSKRPRDK